MGNHILNIIEYKNISKKYKDSLAVKDFSLKISEGSFTVLMGASGSGKTTLLKMVNLLIKPTKGKVLFHGRDNREIRINKLRQDIGYVLQSGALFPHRTVYENIETTLKLLDWEKGKRHQRIKDLMDIIGMDYERYGRRYPAQLSGGQQQRVGIARAIAAQPPVLLMDEPFTALDSIIRNKLQDDLLNIHKNNKATIVFVTHDIDEAFRLGDQIVFIDEGKLIQKGSPRDFLEKPANRDIEKMLTFLSLEAIERINGKKEDEK